MSLFRSLLDQSAKLLFRDLDSATIKGWQYLTGGDPTSSGKQVSAKNAIGLAAVYHAVDLISQDYASLTTTVYENTDSGKNIIRDHNVYRLLNLEPNSYQTPFEYFRKMAVFRLMYGNAYAIIVRTESGEISELIPVHPDNVQEIVEFEGELFYDIRYIKNAIPARDMIHVKDLSIEDNYNTKERHKGKSRIELCKESFGSAMALDEYTSTYYGNGAHPGMVFETEYEASAENRKELLDSLRTKYNGSDKAHKNLVLPPGVKLTQGPTKFSQEQSQFIQTKLQYIEEVARIFNLPLNKMRLKENGVSYNSQEQSNIEYVTDCLRPFSKAFDQEYNRKLFTRDKWRVMVKTSLEGRLRGDMQTQGEFIDKMVKNGVYSINDALGFLNMNKIGPEGDLRYIQSNLMQLGQTPIQDGEENNQQ